MTHHFPCNTVEIAEAETGLCPCGHEPKRPGQGNGKICHAIAQARYRTRQRKRHESAHKIALEAIASRAEQKAKTP